MYLHARDHGVQGERLPVADVDPLARSGPGIEPVDRGLVGQLGQGKLADVGAQAAR